MLIKLALAVTVLASFSACTKDSEEQKAQMVKELLEGKGVPGSAIPPGVVVPEGCFPAPFSIYNIYDLVVLRDFTGRQSDVEGGAIAGSNVDLVDYEIGLKLPADLSSNHLIVGKDLKYNRGSVSKGRVIYGDDVAIERVNIAGGAHKDSVLDFNAVEAVMAGFSKRLLTMMPNGSTEIQNGGPKNHIVLAGERTDLNVWTVPLAEVGKAWGFRIKAPQTSTAIVNIVGEGEISLESFGVTYEGVAGSRTVFHFSDAKKISMGAFGFDGNLLAHKADAYMNNGLLTGHLIAKSFNGGAQINHDPFQGCIPVEGSIPPTPTPTGKCVYVSGCNGRDSSCETACGNKPSKTACEASDDNNGNGIVCLWEIK